MNKGLLIALNEQQSDIAVDNRPVIRGVAPVGLVVACCPPFQVEFIYVLCILRPYQLSNELELLSEPKDSLFEDGYFSGGPSFEDKSRSNRVDQNIQVTLFVDVGNGVEVVLNRLLLFLWVRLVYLALRA